MRDKHRGATSELIAAAWLLRQGYEVFRNVSQHGEADLVAIKGDEVIQIDVKTRPAAVNVNGYFKKVPDHVRVLLVHPDTGACEWCERGPPISRRQERFRRDR